MILRAQRARRGAPIVVHIAALILALAFALAFTWTRPGLAHAQDGAGGYTVQPGDTLSVIAARFGVSLDSLVAANNIADPNLVAVGQILIIPGVTVHAPPGTIATGAVRAEAGDTIASLATRYAQDPSLIGALNALTTTARLFPGRPVLLPEAAVPAEPLRFGSILSVEATPEIPQGRAGTLVIRSSRPLTLAVTWNGLPILPAPLDAATIQAALIPVPALLDPAYYPLVVAYSTRSGVVVTETVAIRVVDGGYESQTISVPSDRSDLLAPERVQAEEAKVGAAWNTFTPDLLLRAPFSRPIGPEYPTSSPYGTRRYYDSGPNSYYGYHAGQDFSAPVGITVTAPATAVVALAEPLDTRGNALILDHGRGIFTGYWHLSEFLVAPGQLVLPGQAIGKVGNTGLSTGAHLHWEMRIFGIAVDPMQFLDEALFPPPKP